MSPPLSLWINIKWQRQFGVVIPLTQFCIVQQTEITNEISQHLHQMVGWESPYWDVYDRMDIHHSVMVRSVLGEYLSLIPSSTTKGREEAGPRDLSPEKASERMGCMGEDCLSNRINYSCN